MAKPDLLRYFQGISWRDPDHEDARESLDSAIRLINSELDAVGLTWWQAKPAYVGSSSTVGIELMRHDREFEVWIEEGVLGATAPSIDEGYQLEFRREWVVAEAAIGLARMAFGPQTICSHLWHHGGYRNGVPDVYCQLCGVTKKNSPGSRNVFGGRG